MNLFFPALLAAFIVTPPMVAHIRVEIAREVLAKAKREEGEPLFMEITLQAEMALNERIKVKSLLLHWAFIQVLSIGLACFLF